MVADRRDARPPWSKKNPKQGDGSKSVPLTGAQKREARERARKAGRPYPNLVDNMAVARASKTTGTKSGATAPRMRVAKTGSRKASTKNSRAK
jgi:hypothetical protein